MAIVSRADAFHGSTAGLVIGMLGCVHGGLGIVQAVQNTLSTSTSASASARTPGQLNRGHERHPVTGATRTGFRHAPPGRPPAVEFVTGQRPALRRSLLRAARRDAPVTAESAWRSAFAVRVDGLRRLAASARRWTTARVSGRAMVSSSHRRRRLEKKAHMPNGPFVILVRSPALPALLPAEPVENKQSEPVHDGQLGAMPAAAVVVNPTKLDDEESFRKSVRRVMDDHGWDEPLWLETTAEDPGRGQAESAVSAGVDLVLACGGDGTVTACAEGVADTGVPLAIIPMGTGNLLARNVGLPTGLDEALAVALDGVQQPIDAGRVNGTMFVVMAGLGLDAQMLDGTSEPLKKRLGWLAYAISAARHLGDRPVRVTVSADGGRRRRMRASMLIVGNVGWLRGGLPLLPDARPDDGMLDAVVLIAGGLTGWLATAAAIALRRPARDRIYRVQFTELQVSLDQEQPWELDGEVMGSSRQLTVVAQPGALLLRMPPESA